jgi:preprotein translocase subunit SecA
MFNRLLRKFFGSRNDRVIRRMQQAVARINALESSFQSLSDSDLKDKTLEFRSRLTQGVTLDSLLPEAFAVVREAASRVLGQRHFDVQLIGGMVLHEGNIAEMRTGEGKTLLETLPAYLNALPGKGVHVITVNDYLVKRDCEWMRPVYESLGLTVDAIYSEQPHEEKKQAYAADITYGTNNEFGFDYLRDNMAFSIESKVQRTLNFAIIDEVDSILIDEARTPLIISGLAEDSSALYLSMNRLIPHLKPQQEEDCPGDYALDEKSRQVFLTEEGQIKVEELMRNQDLLKKEDSLYSAHNITLLHHLNAALRAHTLFQRDVDYIVKDGQVVIVDEHTGRTMSGRRWSEGLHQAIEAKENVDIQQENQTLASITFQNYFRGYQKLSGMTGTADTEAYEFQQIYALEVVVIPTNRPMVRQDMPDLVYLTQAEKFSAIIQDIRACQEKGQPVLVGTASIESSELLSHLLQKEKISHQVLNAKFHEKEAHIIAEAGAPGVITIATNMAGRGTDIVLGGSLEVALQELPSGSSKEEHKFVREAWKKRHDAVLAAGGLRIIGSERHESRRIDNQLRGRAGRQGDAGSSRFYLSLEDSLMRIFASDRLGPLMKKLGMKPGESIEHAWITKAIENAQRKVEGHNFDIRKQLLQYDDVANDQRKVIYVRRAEIMESQNLKEDIESILEEVLNTLISTHVPPESMEEQWDVSSLEQQLLSDFGLSLSIREWLDKEKNLDEAGLRNRIFNFALNTWKEKEARIDSSVLTQFEKSVILNALDTHWKDHLNAMEYLRQGIHLRGYAQKDPKQEYKREAFEMFAEMIGELKYDVASILLRVQVQTPEDVVDAEEKRRSHLAHDMRFEHENVLDALASGVADDGSQDVVQSSTVVPFKRQDKKIGRNEVCPCGSGRKYKHCHGKIQ